MFRSLNLLLVCGLLIVLFGCSCAASQTLTLSLETPGLASGGEKPTSSPAADPPKAPQKQVSSETVRVGLVGVVQVRSAYIYRSKSSTARRFATVKAKTSLAIVKDEGEWFGVLMVNGATGWIARKNVQLTGYELVRDKPQMARGLGTSRGGKPELRVGAFAEQLMQTASQYTGIPYVFGGRSTSGMDCSAFVQTLFKQFGVRLPRTSREQANVGTTVPFDQLQPGDRLYFACKNPHVDHCGVYAGNGYFVHCSKTRNGVGVDSLSSDFFWRSLVVAKRS